MRSFLMGINYNLRGLRMGIRTPALLALGLLRFVLLALITLTAAVLILTRYQDILGLMWARPESAWIAWLWVVASWLLALLLIAVSAVLGFLAAQILFSVLIMDAMSQITEKRATGQVRGCAHKKGWAGWFIHLLRQEIPRAVLPIMLSLLLLVFGWFTPFGLVFTILAPLTAAVLLAWDNTDLVPARRMNAFANRLVFLRTHLGFHLGFGILFLVPLLNLLLLSFAPVGATLYYLEKIDSGGGEGRPIPEVQA